jgi:hypothetical protein
MCNICVRIEPTFAKSSVGRSHAHDSEIGYVGVLNKVGRKRCPRKVVGFPVAGPLGGAGTPVRRNRTGPSRGKARGGCTSPRPSQPRLPASGCDGYISAGDPSSAPIKDSVSSAVLFRKVRVSGGWVDCDHRQILSKRGRGRRGKRRTGSRLVCTLGLVLVRRSETESPAQGARQGSESGLPGSMPLVVF